MALRDDPTLCRDVTQIIWDRLGVAQSDVVEAILDAVDRALTADANRCSYCGVVTAGHAETCRRALTATGPGSGAAACPGYPTWERPEYAIHCAGCSHPNSKRAAPQTEPTGHARVARSNDGGPPMEWAPPTYPAPATPPSGSPPRLHIKPTNPTLEEFAAGVAEIDRQLEALKAQAAAPGEPVTSGSPPGAAEAAKAWKCATCDGAGALAYYEGGVPVVECGACGGTGGARPPESPDGSRGTR